MARLPADNPHRKELFGLMHTIEKQLNMDRNDVMLVLLELNTEEKIQSFFRWIKTRLDGEQVLAAPREIVKAACDISDRRDKTVRIMELTKLCLERPFSTEKIRSYISQNNMDSEEVTRAALEICEHGAFSVKEFIYQNERNPQPEELVTYNWEELFNVLLSNGLDADLVICDDGRNYENILQSIRFLDDGDLNARIARNILLLQGTPNIIIDGETLFGEVDGNLMIDINLGLYPKKWMLDNAFRFWLVLVGFGGLIIDGRSPVNMCDGYQVEIFRAFEKFDYRITYNTKEFDMEIFEKETGTIVATV